MSRTQDQTGGEGSTNLQAGRDVVYNGVTVTEARQIALDVYESNFLKLAGVAEDVARDRAERITRDYLDKLQAENPEGLNSVQDPDMLQAIYSAQKAYACSGEDDLEKVLVDLLVDRSGQGDRNLKTLALNEAITALPKLSIRQRNSVAVCFFIRHTRYTGPLIPMAYYAALAQSITPFAEMLSERRVDYQHIQSTGAGWISVLTLELGAAFSEVARGYFTKGFTADQVPEDLRAYLDDPELFVPCIRDQQRLQLNARSRDQVMQLATAKSINSKALDNLSQVGLMSSSDIQSELENYVPGMKTVFERWNNDESALHNLELTSVGIAIGHAYWRQVTGILDAPLDIWL